MQFSETQAAELTAVAMTEIAPHLKPQLAHEPQHYASVAAVVRRVIAQTAVMSRQRETESETDAHHGA